jgi:hypothetical protein
LTDIQTERKTERKTETDREKDRNFKVKNRERQRKRGPRGRGGGCLKIEELKLCKNGKKWKQVPGLHEMSKSKKRQKHEIIFFGQPPG